MLLPKRTKYRRVQKGKNNGNATRGHLISFGSFAIKSIDPMFITSRQIEAARIALTRYLKREGKVWIRIFPDKPYTKKPAEVRMGSGKGSVDHYVAPVRPGRVLFEMAGIREDLAREAFRLAAFKLPMKTQFITREEHSA